MEFGCDVRLLSKGNLVISYILQNYVILLL